MNLYKILLLFIFLLSSLSFSNERYICSHGKNNTIQLITNFYIINDKLIMSGASVNGEYKILNKTKNGILAINSSFIGKDFGLETILLDKKKKIFFYKTFINNSNKSNILLIQGDCNFKD